MLDGIFESMNMSLSKLWEKAQDREGCYAEVHGLQRVGCNLVTEPQQQ